MTEVLSRPRQRSAVAVAEPLAVPPAEAFGILRVGNTKGYELIGAGELEAFKIGTATRITMDSIRAYIARQVAAGKAA